MNSDLLNSEKLELPGGLGIDSILLLLMFGGAIFGFFYLLKNYVFPLIESQKLLAKIKVLSFRGEVIVWGVFALFSVAYLLVGNPLITLVLLALIVGLGFQFWRDFFPGLIFRLSAIFAIGETVVFGGINGKIVSIGRLAVQLKTENEELFYIPYRKMTEDVRTKQQAKGKLLSAKLIFPIGDTPADIVLSNLQKSIHQCPWAIANMDAHLQILDQNRVAITVYALDEFSLAKVEQFLKNKWLD